MPTNNMFVAANRASTTLNGTISAVATAITVADGSVFPSSGRFKITIENEIIDIASRTGNALTVEARGSESTTGAIHTDGVTVAMQFTAGHYADIITAMENVRRLGLMNE